MPKCFKYRLHASSNAIKFANTFLMFQVLPSCFLYLKYRNKVYSSILSIIKFLNFKKPQVYESLILHVIV